MAKPGCEVRKQIMNLDSRYLGLTLRSPLVVSALPLSRSLDHIKQMEDAGAGAIVLYSLFEEQIRVEGQILDYYREHPTATPADVQARFPAQKQFPGRIDDYLDHIAEAKRAVTVPIIASLNCDSLGNWTDVAQQIEQAGADALELNIYHIPTNLYRTAEQVEDSYVMIVNVVKSTIKIPVAVKLTPYFTCLSAMVRRLDAAKADALVLFNRFYQPDFDPKTLSLTSTVPPGSPSDSRLPLHWIAALYGYVRADMAATGGIYSAEDVVKMLMVGARVTMLASVLLKEGIGYLRTLEQALRLWLEENDYESVAGLQGIMRQFHSKNSSAFERSQYLRVMTPRE